MKRLGWSHFLPDPASPREILLPTTATAPFCPSAVSHSVAVPADASSLRKLALFIGPGLLVSVGYMDPGNWATAIGAGSRFGYALLFVVVLASFSGMLLQSLCSRLGIATGRDPRSSPGSATALAWRVANGCWRNCRSSLPTLPRCSARRWPSTCCWSLDYHRGGPHRLRYPDRAGLQGANFRRLEAIVWG